MEGKEKKEEEKRIVCGLCLLFKKDGQVQLLAIKLFKYSISISPILHEQPQFIDFFVSDLINTAKIHATHKFIIQGRQSEHNFAFVIKQV